MLNLLGEYDCKVDTKGRIMFPSGLKKQLANAFDKGFVINRNLHEKCLVLYPVAEWEKISSKLGKLNRLVKKNDKLIRHITRGATTVNIDNSGRLLFPKPLIDYAEITKEVKVMGSGNVIEVWNKSIYLDELNGDIDMESLAEDILGGLDFDE